MTVIKIIIDVYALIVGLIIGSFLNVCIFRIPAKESIVFGSSHCMTCKNKIEWYDLVPVFSYIFLRGKCRHCKEPISIRYPIIESLTGILFLLSFVFFDFIKSDGSFVPEAFIKALIFCAFFSVLIVVSMIDFDTMEIPDRFHLIILGLGIISLLVLKDVSWKERLLGAVIVSIPMFVIVLFGGMGAGDAKLMAVSGLMLGAKAIVIAFFIGVICAAVYGVIFKIKNPAAKSELQEEAQGNEKAVLENAEFQAIQTEALNTDAAKTDDAFANQEKAENIENDEELDEFNGKTPIPFGPFLSIGIAVAAFVGAPLVDWYISSFINY